MSVTLTHALLFSLMPSLVTWPCSEQHHPPTHCCSALSPSSPSYQRSLQIRAHGEGLGHGLRQRLSNEQRAGVQLICWQRGRRRRKPVNYRLIPNMDSLSSAHTTVVYLIFIVFRFGISQQQIFSLPINASNGTNLCSSTNRQTVLEYN